MIYILAAPASWKHICLKCYISIHVWIIINLLQTLPHTCSHHFLTKPTSQVVKLRQTWTVATVWLYPAGWLESSFAIVLVPVCSCVCWEATVWSRLLLSCSSALSLKCEMWSRRAASTYQDLADETKSPTIWALTSVLSLSACKRERKRAAFTRQRRLGDRMDPGCLVIQ